MVAAVATLEPEMAAKIAHEKMLATASPPGRNNTQRATAVYSPLPMPECRRMPLMNTKSGTAMNEKLDACDQAIEPTTPSPMVNPLSQRRPSMPTIPSAIDTSTPAANRTNISPINTPPRADSLTRRSGVSRAARRSHLVAGGSSTEGRPHLPDQRGEHREGHEGQAGGHEEHRRPEWIQHDRRDTAVREGRGRGPPGVPDDDGEA